MTVRRAKTIRTLALLLLLGFAALPAVNPVGAAAQQDGRKPRAGVYLVDDWAGNASKVEWAAGSAVTLGWRDLEPLQGQYAFGRVELWLAVVKAGGKIGSLEIRLSCGESGANSGATADAGAAADGCAPEWALAWDPVILGARRTLNFLDPRVGTGIAALADALARRYAADARLSHITIGLGCEGSASPCQTGPAAAWTQYLIDTVTSFSGSFERSGGPGHTPLFVTFTGGSSTRDERRALAQAAARLGLGLDDQDWAASFHTGEFEQAACSEDGSEAARTDGTLLDGSHWETMEVLSAQVPVAVRLKETKSEAALTDEENAWWSVLNALDKGSQIFYVDKDDARWGDAWRFFARSVPKGSASDGNSVKAGSANSTAWIALRGASGAWCGDTGDFEWQLRRTLAATGGSARRSSLSRPGGRVGESWRGAYTRSTDLGSQRPALYFDVDDRLLFGGEHIVLAEVAYYDGDLGAGGASWELRYDSSQGPNSSAGEVSLQGTGKWLVHPFVLTDAAMGNRLTDAAGRPGSDLSLVARDGDVAFHMISLRILPDGDGSPQRAPRSTPEPVLPPAAETPEAQTAGPVTPEPTSLPSVTAEHAEAAGLPAAAGAAPPPGPGDPFNDDVLTAMDTYVDAMLPDDNFASANNLVLRGDGSKFGLIRFDLAGLVPAEAEDPKITSAWLELTVVGRTRPAPFELALVAPSTTWEAGSATWASTGKDPTWAPGPTGGAEPAPASLPAVGSIQIPVTDIVQGWIERPETNRGLTLRGSGANDLEYYIASSEWRGVVARPRLRIRSEGGVAWTKGRGDRPGVRTEPVSAPAETPTPVPTASGIPDPLITPIGMPSPGSLLVHVANVEEDPDLGEAKSKITVYSYQPDGSAPCSSLPELDLWAAAGQHPAQLIAGSAVRRLTDVDGVTFPVWEFSDVDLAAARRGEVLLHLFATSGADSRHNVVTLGAAAGTDYPSPAAPLKTVKWDGGAVDASLEILWPQDGKPVSGTAPVADKANLSVALFRHGSRDVLSADPSFQPVVRLHWSLNDGPDLAGPNPPVGKPRLVQTPWLTYFLWDFPDVDISAARQSGNYLNFWAEVDGVGVATTNVWSHGYGPHPATLALPPSSGCR